MSKTILFSRVFPKYHLKAGQPTFFVEKILSSINYKYYDEDRQFNPRISVDSFDPKLHTIRAGKRWNVGDVFSPRVWTDKPYKSKHIIICPDIEVKQVYDIEIINQKVIINGVFWGSYARGFYDKNVNTLAHNDGLSLVDFENWFGNKFFQGQIICWSDSVSYCF